MNYNGWQFMGDHPILTFFIAFFITQGAVYIAAEIRKAVVGRKPKTEKKENQQ
jgi:hypothetical protein